MLTSHPIRDFDEKGKPTQRRKLLTNSAQRGDWEHEGEKKRVHPKPDYKNWSERTVIIASNAAETGATLDNCMLVGGTCLVNAVYHDPSTNVKVQVPMPCSEAAADQRAGKKTGITCEIV